MLGYFPKNIAKQSIMCYFITLSVITILFYQHSLPIYIILFGIISILAFFYGSNVLTKKWYKLPQKRYESNVFKLALLIRLIYVIFIYYLNYSLYGTFHESNGGDIGFYIETSLQALSLVSDYDFIELWRNWGIQLDDMGYMLYLFLIYIFTSEFSTIILPLIFKAIWGALTCVYISRMAYNHFGNSVGYMTGIFCAFQFNMIWWCGSMMKETEMLFLLVYFLYSMDDMIIKNKFPINRLIITLSVGLSLFLFRTVLGAVAIVSVLLCLILGESRVKNKSKRFLMIGVIMLFMGILFYELFTEQFNQLITIANDSSYQEKNMNWRTTRTGGNDFAKYAGAAVFAPLIFTIPFPTMVYTFQEQEMQMQAHGGYFIKNIMSFFVIFVMFYLLKTKEWRRHIVPIAFTCGYLVALVMSVFAQSGRFHLLVIPFEMMFAAYGITLMNKKRMKWFQYALIFECVVCIAWSWFKLAGRGMA